MKARPRQTTSPRRQRAAVQAGAPRKTPWRLPPPPSTRSRRETPRRSTERPKARPASSHQATFPAALPPPATPIVDSRRFADQLARANTRTAAPTVAQSDSQTNRQASSGEQTVTTEIPAAANAASSSVSNDSSVQGIERKPATVTPATQAATSPAQQTQQNTVEKPAPALRKAIDQAFTSDRRNLATASANAPTKPLASPDPLASATRAASPPLPTTTSAATPLARQQPGERHRHRGRAHARRAEHADACVRVCKRAAPAPKRSGWCQLAADAGHRDRARRPDTRSRRNHARPGPGVAGTAPERPVEPRDVCTGHRDGCDKPNPHPCADQRSATPFRKIAARPLPHLPRQAMIAMKPSPCHKPGNRSVAPPMHRQ